MRCIRCTHYALITNAVCICPEMNEEEKAVFQDLCIQLAEQLTTLRQLAREIHGVDPLANTGVLSRFPTTTEIQRVF